MKPFAVFKAPDKLRWLSRPQGKNRYRVEMFVVLPDGKRESTTVTPDKPCTITDLMPTLSAALDDLHEGREVIDYGFSAYVWG